MIENIYHLIPSAELQTFHNTKSNKIIKQITVDIHSAML